MPRKGRRRPLKKPKRKGRRRPLKKPKGKEGFCWAWKKGQKARGEKLEKAKWHEAAEELRCHRLPDPATGRCYLHGGTSKAGPTHPIYKHGAFSTYFTGVLKAGARFYDELQVLASLRDELAVNKALIAHKLGEINAAGPLAGRGTPDGRGDTRW